MNLNEYQERYPHENVWCSIRPLVTVQPVLIDNYRLLIRQGMLQFDEDTAGHLAGPFEGNYGYYRIVDCSNRPDLLSTPAFHLKHRFSRHNFPSRMNFKQDALSEEHLQKRLQLLSNRERKEWEGRLAGREIDDATIEKPISLYLCGNDDASYTKWFATVTEAHEEISLLEAIQPLNFGEAISNNGFVFTN